MGAGELFILGFQGETLPPWMPRFAERHGLGGVILFDYDYQAKSFDNNIRSPDQVAELCVQIQEMESSPLVFIDQEGGKVRRLKEERGFKPLPSAESLAQLPMDERRRLLKESVREMGHLGIDFDLAPVIDLNYNPASPGLGAVGRSMGVDPAAVRENARLWGEAAEDAGINLCVKHYPGLGGATVDSHLGLAVVGDSVAAEQLALFEELPPTLPGNALLVSHGIVKGWHPTLPATLSPEALGPLRRKLPETLFISDDMQMRGVLDAMPLAAACDAGLSAGLDMIIIGNNLFRLGENEIFALAEALEARNDLAPKIARVAKRKA